MDHHVLPGWGLQGVVTLDIEHAGVRLMNDYGTHWPVWWIDGGFATAGELGLSDDLQSRLRGWATQFSDHFAPETGWDSTEVAREHLRSGRALADELRRAIAPMVVRAEFWEHDAIDS